MSPYALSATKRVTDVCLGLLTAVLTLPLLLLASVASALSFRAWPFFVQDRIGKDVEIFRFVKIRSLPESFNPTADKYSVAQSKNTFVGNFLRHTHLDDLPQLWLVVIGRMSMVGPRPELPSIAARFEPEFFNERSMVRPGVTGLWQLSTGASNLIAESPSFDRFYVRNASFRFDLWLFAQTIRHQMGGAPLAIDDVSRFSR